MPCTAPSRNNLRVQGPCGYKALTRAGMVAPGADAAKAYWSMSDPALAVEQVVGANGVYNQGTFPTGIEGPFPGLRATRFDGLVTSRAIVPATVGVTDTGDVFSWETWIRLRPGMPGGVHWVYGHVFQWIIRVNGGAVEFFKSSFGAMCTATVTVPFDKWTHVAVTKNAAAIKMYQDGVDVTGTVTNQTCGNSGQPANIGGYQGSNGMFGDLYGVAVYTAALTQAQIQAHALGKDASADSLCQFHYQMKYGQSAVRQPTVVEP
jgi:Concanavalin A-like lectin/glucanases superfamily